VEEDDLEGSDDRRWLRKSMQMNNKGIKDVIAKVNQ